MDGGVDQLNSFDADAGWKRTSTSMDAVELCQFLQQVDDDIKDSLIEQLTEEVKHLKVELLVSEQERLAALNRLAASERRCAELRENVDELERKWQGAQVEIAELNVMHGLRRQTAQADESGLRKELELTRQNLELYENLTAAAKMRELEQKNAHEIGQITKRLASTRHLRKYSFMQRQADHEKRLREVRRELIDKLIAPSIAAIMYEGGGLTLTELESVQRCRTPAESAKNLVDIVASLPYENYECFLKALKLADQESVYLWLAYKDYNINVKHTETIRRHYIYLLEALDMKFTILLAELSSAGILNAGEKDEINSEQCITHQNERLLSVLSRKSAEQFETFLGALDRSGQKHIADRLREKSSDDSSQSVSADLTPKTTTLEVIQVEESPVPPPRRQKRKRDIDKVSSTTCGSIVVPFRPPRLQRAAIPTPVQRLSRTTSLPSLRPLSTPTRSASSGNIIDDVDASDDAATNQPQIPALFHSQFSQPVCPPRSPAAARCEDVVCVIVGDADVDKTNLLLSFLYPDISIGVNRESYTEVALHMSRKLVTVGNVTYNLLLKDTTGHEEFDRLRILSYGSADVFVVCFSVINQSSFDNVRDKWIPEIRRHCPCKPFILVGTQKERRIPMITTSSTYATTSSCSSTVVGTNVYATLARRNEAKYLECSTTSREGVDEVFTAAVEAKSRANHKRKLKFKPFRVL